MIRSPFFVLLLGMLSLFLLAGCGGGSGSDAPPQPPVVFYAITSDVNPEDGGTVLGTGNYRSGTSFTLTAVPAPGFVFFQWVEGGAKRSSIGSVELFGTASEDRDITAEFLPATLELSPDDLTLIAGAPATLSATLLVDGEDPVDVSSAASWFSSNNELVTVTDQGTVTAVAEGEVSIAAEFGGQVASARILVREDSLESLTFEPSTVTLFAGGAPYFPTLIATYASGAEVALPLDRAQWSSSSAAASVSQAGVVTAVEIGTAEITAAAGNEQGTLIVSVTGTPLGSLEITTVSAPLSPDRRLDLFVGDQVQFRALGTYPGVGEVDLTDRVTWFSDSDALTLINGGANAGLASALSETDEVSVSASVDGLDAVPVKAAITIDPERPAAVSLQLPGDVIRLVENELFPTMILDAVVKNGLGRAVSGPVNLIFSVASGPLTFDDDSNEQIVTAENGTASITATATGLGQALVRVRLAEPSLADQARVFVVDSIDDVLLGSRSESIVEVGGEPRLRVRFTLLNQSQLSVPVKMLRIRLPGNADRVLTNPDGAGPNFLPFDSVPGRSIVGQGILFDPGTEGIEATYTVEDPETGQQFDIQL